MMRTRKVSAAEADALYKRNWDNIKANFVWTTPAADVKQVEDLLQLPNGSLAKHEMSSKCDIEQCECGRKFSWLDIIASGLKVHDKAFIASVLMGNDNYITEGHIPISCFSCGRQCAASEWYSCRTSTGASYSCWGAR